VECDTESSHELSGVGRRPNGKRFGGLRLKGGEELVLNDEEKVLELKVLGGSADARRI
jgi:hypothetical protein